MTHKNKIVTKRVWQSPYLLLCLSEVQAMEITKEDFLEIHVQLSKLEERMFALSQVNEELKSENDRIKSNLDRLSSNDVALKQEIDNMKEKDQYFG